jgi:hypothetical protein
MEEVIRMRKLEDVPADVNHLHPNSAEWYRIWIAEFSYLFKKGYIFAKQVAVRWSQLTNRQCFIIHRHQRDYPSDTEWVDSYHVSNIRFGYLYPADEVIKCTVLRGGSWVIEDYDALKVI